MSGDNNQAYTMQQKEEMFEYWSKCQDIKMTAEQFKCSRSTIYRFMDENQWLERYAKIKDKIQEATDRKVVQEIKSNLKYVTIMKKKLVQKFIDTPVKKLKANVQDVIRLMEYEDQLLGNLDREERLAKSGDTNTYIYNYNNMEPEKRDLARVNIANMLRDNRPRTSPPSE